MDDLVRIPGTSIRVGLDPLLGLAPGLGDWVSWLISGHLLWCAWRLGVSAPTLLRMSGYLAIDAVVGSVPALGTVFDVAWRANDRNLSILERHVAAPAAVKRENRVLAGAVLGAGGVVAVAAGWAGWTVFRAVLGWFGV